MCSTRTVWMQTCKGQKNQILSGKSIRIYHECEGRIEKPVSRITLWHHKASEKSIPRINLWHQESSQVMLNGDPEGGIFLSYPHMNNGFFFLLTTVFFNFEISFHAKMQFHMMTSLKHSNDVT